MPAPTCTSTRPATSISKLVACAQITAPSVHTAIATASSSRRDRRSLSQPPTRLITTKGAAPTAPSSRLICTSLMPSVRRMGSTITFIGSLARSRHSVNSTIAASTA